MKLQIIIPNIHGEHIKELANIDGRSISGYCRKIILEKIGSER